MRIVCYMSENPRRRHIKSMRIVSRQTSRGIFQHRDSKRRKADKDVTTADSRSIRELSTSIVKIGCPATGRIWSMLSAKTDSLSEVA